MTTKTLRRIENLAEQLIKGAKSLYLSNIAKSIEQEEGCQIFMVPLDDDGPDIKSTCWVATCASYMSIEHNADRSSSKESEIIPISHHFIFYKPCPEDIEVERRRIAHCLAHCALHWPLGPRSKRLVSTTFHGVNVYMVRFSQEEEEEADALACLLTAHEPAV